LKNETPNRWEDIPWREAVRYVFKLQQRVFDAENRGDKNTVNRLQQKIANSFYAKALAVRQVAQFSKGKNTAGIDGVKALKPAEKLRMATELTIHHRPSAVRRKWIPKPGKDELRPLGIPNLIDRAFQALLVLILEPQWEAHFSKHQYGFRKGRGPHDAINFIQRHLRKAGPKWVLEIDIEKFFDQIDHEELLRRLDAPPAIADAVKRTLRAGVLADGEHADTLEGTPQGGPLSPLLANIALAGLEAHLEREFRRHYARRITALGLPTLVIYADDAVVLHKDRGVVEWCQTAIQEYLTPLGLKLSSSKTRISHTQQQPRPGEGPGFDFLGFHVQHHWKKEEGGVKVPYILATPSKRSVERFYRNCADFIDSVKLSRKQRGARRDSQARGRKDPVTVMIIILNIRIRGWVNNFRSCNAKQTFSRLDSLLHEKLWQWAVRRFDRKPVQWIIDHLFSGVERDKDGNPLLRRDGNLRQRKWAFKSPFVPNDKSHVTLLKLADTPIRDHILVKPKKRFFDGDWPYWQVRITKSRYHATPPMVPIAALRRQQGKCATCGKLILKEDRLTTHRNGMRHALSHAVCIKSPSSAPEPPSLTGLLESGCSVQARCAETCPPGFSGSQSVRIA
jgi:RNA-directed DNA polymerase